MEMNKLKINPLVFDQGPDQFIELNNLQNDGKDLPSQEKNQKIAQDPLEQTIFTKKAKQGLSIYRRYGKDKHLYVQNLKKYTFVQLEQSLNCLRTLRQETFNRDQQLHDIGYIIQSLETKMKTRNERYTTFRGCISDVVMALVIAFSLSGIFFFAAYKSSQKAQHYQLAFCCLIFTIVFSCTIVILKSNSIFAVWLILYNLCYCSCCRCCCEPCYVCCCDCKCRCLRNKEQIVDQSQN